MHFRGRNSVALPKSDNWLQTPWVPAGSNDLTLIASAVCYHEMGFNISYGEQPFPLHHPIQSGTGFLLATGWIVIRDVVQITRCSYRVRLKSLCSHLVKNRRLFAGPRHANLQPTVIPNETATENQSRDRDNTQQRDKTFIARNGHGKRSLPSSTGQAKGFGGTGRIERFLQRPQLECLRFPAI